MANRFAETVFRKRRIRALGICSAALFLLSCLLWSIPIDGYVSSSEIELSLADSKPAHQQQFQKLLETILLERTSDRGLASSLAKLTRNGATEDIQILNGELARVREGLTVGMKGMDEPNRYKLTIEYRGARTAKDDELVRDLARQLATDFQQHPLSQLPGISMLAADEYGIGEKHELQRAEIQQAIGLANQIEEEFADASDSLNGYIAQVSLDQDDAEREELGEESLVRIKHQRRQDRLSERLDVLLDQRHELLDKFTMKHPDVLDLQAEIERIRLEIVSMAEKWPAIQAESRSSSFMNAGYKKQLSTPSMESLENVQQSLANVGSLDLQGKLETLESLVAESSAAFEAQQSDLGNAANFMPGELLKVHRVVGKGARPAGHAPNLAHAILFGLTALLFGSIVAMGLRPEQMDSPFESVESVRSALGVPVIGKINCEPAESTEPESVKKCWANRLVRICELGLFAIVILMAIFMLVDSGVREAFFRNPFDGLSRIVWRLMGS